MCVCVGVGGWGVGRGIDRKNRNPLPCGSKQTMARQKATEIYMCEQYVALSAYFDPGLYKGNPVSD